MTGCLVSWGTRTTTEATSCPVLVTTAVCSTAQSTGFCRVSLMHREIQPGAGFGGSCAWAAGGVEGFAAGAAAGGFAGLRSCAAAAWIASAHRPPAKPNARDRETLPTAFNPVKILRTARPGIFPGIGSGRYGKSLRRIPAEGTSPSMNEDIILE